MRRLWSSICVLLLLHMPAEAVNRLKSSGWDVHELILDETADVFRAGTTERHAGVTTRPAGVRADFAGLPASDASPASTRYTSREIKARFPFNDVVPSWNVDVPDGTGFLMELRFRVHDTDRWTPYYYLGCWGKCPKVEEKVLANDDGTIDQDYFQSKKRFDRLQYRVSLYGPPGGPGPCLRRMGLAYSNTLGDKDLYKRLHADTKVPPAARWQRRLPVPYRSQMVEDPSIRGGICSPTSVSMVLEYRGVNRPTRAVCDVIYDAEYRMYGNWARAVQGAYVYGIPGYVRRFGNWDEVKALIAQDQPVIASIRVPKGTLTGSPYPTSRGHLLVVAGFDEHGDIQVNDPAAKPPNSGQITYKADEFKAVWLDNGGVAYILLPPEPNRTRSASEGPLWTTEPEAQARARCGQPNPKRKRGPVVDNRTRSASEGPPCPPRLKRGERFCAF